MKRELEVIIRGPAGEGKTTFMFLLRNLLEENNVSANVILTFDMDIKSTRQAFETYRGVALEDFNVQIREETTSKGVKGRVIYGPGNCEKPLDITGEDWILPKESE